MEGWKRVLRLQESSSGPFVQVDETAVTASWMDGGKKMVKLLDGQVFEVKHTDDVPAPPAKIKFKSSDGVEFEMDRVVARKSSSLTIMLVNTSRTGSIPVVEVKSKILQKVLDYCYKHFPRITAATVAAAAANAEASAEELKSWDADFVKVDLDTLYHLVRAARYLGIEGLEDLACRAVADITEGKTPEEIRTMFNIKKDMTPEEEEVAVRELHAWRQRATSSSSANMGLTPEEAEREWMDIVNTKFCTYYELDF